MLKIQCETCVRVAAGKPRLTYNVASEEWELDLSEMYCPNEPSHHPDQYTTFDVQVTP
jgi:hypothetical protein